MPLAICDTYANEVGDSRVGITTSTSGVAGKHVLYKLVSARYWYTPTLFRRAVARKEMLRYLNLSFVYWYRKIPAEIGLFVTCKTLNLPAGSEGRIVHSLEQVLSSRQHPSPQWLSSLQTSEIQWGGTQWAAGRQLRGVSSKK